MVLYLSIYFGKGSLVSTERSIHLIYTTQLAECIIEIPHKQSLSDILDVLTQHSLINREFQDGQTTYTILKSIRDYLATQAEPLLIRATHHRLSEHLAHRLQTEENVFIHSHLLEVAAFQGSSDSATICCQHLLERLKPLVH